MIRAPAYECPMIRALTYECPMIRALAYGCPMIRALAYANIDCLLNLISGAYLCKFNLPQPFSYFELV